MALPLKPPGVATVVRATEHGGRCCTRALERRVDGEEEIGTVFRQSQDASAAKGRRATVGTSAAARTRASRALEPASTVKVLPSSFAEASARTWQFRARRVHGVPGAPGRVDGDTSVPPEVAVPLDARPRRTAQRNQQLAGGPGVVSMAAQHEPPRRQSGRACALHFVGHRSGGADGQEDRDA